MEKKDFLRCDVMSVLIGTNISKCAKNACDLLTFMTGEKCKASNFDELSKKCVPIILQAYPHLECPQMQFAIQDLTKKLKETDNADAKEKIISEWLVSLVTGERGFKCLQTYTLFPLRAL